MMDETAYVNISAQRQYLNQSTSLLRMSVPSYVYANYHHRRRVALAVLPHRALHAALLKSPNQIFGQRLEQHNYHCHPWPLYASQQREQQVLASAYLKHNGQQRLLS
jgi:hypothetical protein